MHVRVLHRIGRSQRTGPRPRPGWLLALAALALVGVVAAGCGSSNNNSGGSSSGGGGTSGGGTSGGGGGYGGGGAPTTGAATSATVSTSNTKLGQILVDGSGRTLYLFQKDQPNQSACSGACVSAWPVDQSTGTPKAANGVKASMLGTIKRTDGTTQVTYNKHPLYYYSGDSGPGQQNGQNLNAFGAKWYVVAPAGSAVT
jgi:predicted lipoprotein with Yx(FWY)xxD motif